MKEFAPSFKKETLDRFLARVEYVPVDVLGEAGWPELIAMLRPDVIRAFYLSVGPSLFFRHCTATAGQWPGHTG